MVLRDPSSIAVIVDPAPFGRVDASALEADPDTLPDLRDLLQAPPERSPQAEALALEIEHKLARLGQEDDHAVLGVRPDATLDEIRSAYLLLVRWFHPKRLSPFGLDYLRGPAQLIVARLGQAYAALRRAQQPASLPLSPRARGSSRARGRSAARCQPSPASPPAAGTGIPSDTGSGSQRV